MAGDKMSDKSMDKSMGKGMMCEGCMGMGKLCGSITGLLVLVAGAVWLLAYWSMLSAMTATLISGVCFVLVGISLIVHALGMCGMCKKKMM